MIDELLETHCAVPMRRETSYCGVLYYGLLDPTKLLLRPYLSPPPSPTDENGHANPYWMKEVIGVESTSPQHRLMVSPWIYDLVEQAQARGVSDEDQRLREDSEISEQNTKYIYEE